MNKPTTKTETVWAIANDRIALTVTVSPLRKWAIEKMVKNWNESWEDLQKRGYRAVKCQLTYPL